MSLTLRSVLALTLFVGFYVFALVIAGGLLWVAWWLTEYQSAGTLKLQWACVAGAGIVLWSMRPRADHFEPPGPKVTEADQPALFKAIKEVADAAQQPVPKDVYIAGDVTAWVSDRGGIGGVGGHRVMTLGLPLMQELSVAELKAVIAHEFGHFSAGDTSLGRLVHRTHGAIGRTLAETEGRLVEWLFRAYAALFLRVSMAVSRAQEFAADAFAARVTSGAALATSLGKVERAGAVFPLYAQFEYAHLVDSGFRPPLAAGFARFQTRPIARSVHEHVAATPPARSPYDSHPPNPERIAALEATPASSSLVSPGSPGDHAPAISLLRDLPALERGVLAIGGADVSKLTEIEWDDVPARVWVPAWREIVQKDAGALKAIVVEALPLSTADAVAAGRQIGTPQAKLMDADDLAVQVSRSATVAVALRLVDAGWTLEDADGIVHLRQGDVTVVPFDPSLAIVAETDEARAAWAEFRKVTGLGGTLEPPHPVRGPNLPLTGVAD